NVAANELLGDPRHRIKLAVARIGDHGAIPSSHGKNSTALDIPPADVYRNSPLVNFAYKDSQEKMQGALREVRKRFGEKYPLVIGGEKIWTDQLTPSVNPSAPDEIVGYGSEAGIPEAERAVRAAREAFGKWTRTPFDGGAHLLD